MRKLLTLTAATAFVVAFGFGFAAPASADKQTNCSNSGAGDNCTIIKGADGQADHALYDGVGDTAIYCGVTVGDESEPWTLHVSASAAGTNGSVKITFDGGDPNDSIEYFVPAGTSFSTTQALGGVPEVDTLVKITATGSLTVMMASAKVKLKATDPFDEVADIVNSGDAESDNYCITAPGDPGATIPSGNPFGT